MFIESYRLKNFLQRGLALFFQFIDYGIYHPVRISQVRASKETSQYIHKNLNHAIGFYTQQGLMEFASAHVKIDGSFLEFGVYKGGSITQLSKLFPDKKIHGFDSFEGLPSSWGGYTLKQGDFNMMGKIPKVPKNVKLHVGWFDKTIPAWVQDFSEPISLIHIDCDLYVSTSLIFTLLGDYIVPGTVVLFDEYFGYSGWREHEYKAFQEFISQRALGYKYLGYSKYQVAVLIE